MTKKIYCPQCEEEVKIYTFPGKFCGSWLMYCKKCLGCNGEPGRYYIEMDCVTEEQLSSNPEQLENEKSESSNHIVDTNKKVENKCDNEWIDIVDRKPKFEQLIIATFEDKNRFQKSGLLGLYKGQQEEGKAILYHDGCTMIGFLKWKPALSSDPVIKENIITDKESLTVQEPKECEHDWFEYQHPGTPFGVTSTCCKKCEHFKGLLKEPVKTQSQIAIDKVIQAFEYRIDINTGQDGEDMAVVSALEYIIDKLKEINK